MAFSATPHRPSLLRLPRGSSSSSRPLYSVHFQPSRANLNLRRSLYVQSSSVPAAPSVAPAISLTDNALKHLNKMRSDRGQDLCLRIGVKQGGCSGMSYAMDFEDKAKTRPDDSVLEFNGFVMVCDPKSLLFLYGMQLDFSDALIGGGFTFKNPNATQTCGCGTSFAAEMRRLVYGSFGLFALFYLSTKLDERL